MLRITQQNSAKTRSPTTRRRTITAKARNWSACGAAKARPGSGWKGSVDKPSFERLCDNLDPRTGKPLTVRTRSERTVGYDFTFSVPKSVSLLYAMSGDEGILDAFRAAVAETMRDMEAEMKTPHPQDSPGHRPHDGQHGLGGIHPHHVTARGRAPRSAIARPRFRLQHDLGRRGRAAGRPASSANSNAMPRTSRRPFASAWPASSRSWASASSVNATISRLPVFRRTC